MNVRKMARVAFAFTDVVVGRPVYYWRDHKGRYWLSERARFAWRTPVAHDDEDLMRMGAVSN